MFNSVKANIKVSYNRQFASINPQRIITAENEVHWITSPWMDVQKNKVCLLTFYLGSTIHIELKPHYQYFKKNPFSGQLTYIIKFLDDTKSILARQQWRSRNVDMTSTNDLNPLVKAALWWYVNTWFIDTFHERKVFNITVLNSPRKKMYVYHGLYQTWYL